LLGLAHTKTNADFSCCAYTQKVAKLARMLPQIGETIHYGAEGSVVPCEHVTVISDEEQEGVYGRWDWRADYNHSAVEDLANAIFKDRAEAAIRERVQPGDFLLVTFGNYQRALADALAVPLTVESGIGYEGLFARFRVFESYAWMHYMYGRMDVADGCWYDAVIPNYFDPADFQFQPKAADRPEAYLLYVGRLIERKGIAVAMQVAAAAGMRLVVAGPGDPALLGISTHPSVRFVGPVQPTQRSVLMGAATALLAPTTYIEPFGGVAVEAQMCGTPVITTDWGAFTETVEHGVTGFRCRTFDDFLFAVRTAPRLDRRAIRERAVRLYSLERATQMYREYFSKLADMAREGWYAEHPERTNLDWLRAT
jgi:glycosyltransferase involved in cell wall biosynthesis